MMQSLSEQSAAVNFCFLLGKNSAETVVMLKTAYKDDAMGKTQMYEWFARFKNVTCRLMIILVLDVHELPESTKMLKKFERLCSQTAIRQVIKCQSLVEHVLTEDLGMKRFAAKFVNQALIDNKKNHQVKTCRALKQQLVTDPYFLTCQTWLRATFSYFHAWKEA